MIKDVHINIPKRAIYLPGNVGESGMLFRRQCTYAIDTNQRVCHCPVLIHGSNAIMYFIELEGKLTLTASEYLTDRVWSHSPSGCGSGTIR